ncbi:MAG: hypothetical protein K9H49_14140 [Bacteroidales bacterium]|nr:hypothetical protein [Bacteroidales bacterium]MCF8390834.1 hypothetical protein [Bacteroidales bacterium]
MYKSVFYKEWIKTKWFLILLSLIGLLAVGNIFLKVQHNITFNGANKYWYLILFQNQLYFKSLKFVPLLIGLTIALIQYIPEIMDKRIKLTFHLPINEDKILLIMLGYGTFGLVVSFGLIFSFFSIMSSHYFGKEIVDAAIISVLPWFLAGLAAYFLAALVILEAIWKYRALYFIAAASFLLLFFEGGIAGSYSPVNFKLIILTLLISISLIFSAYRFRKGEM